MTEVRRQFQLSAFSFQLCAAAALLLLPLPLHAGIVLNNPITWDSGLQSWTNDNPDLPGDGYGTIQNFGPGVLRLTFAAQGGPAMPENDTMYSSETNVTGDYTAIQSLGVTFTFTVNDELPGDAALYLHSAVTTSLWTYAFSPSMGANTISIAFDYGMGGWAGPGGEAEFLADLVNIDWIGVNVARNEALGAQTFDLDNWEYIYIPEPGTWAMLAAAFMSLAIPFRKRIA